MSKPMHWMLIVACCVCAASSVPGCGADDDDGGAGMGAAASGGGGGSGGTGGGASGASGAAAGGGAPAGMGSAGCGSESFAAIYQDILSNESIGCNTVACHGKMAGQTATVGNLELITKDAAYMDLVGVKSDSALCGDGARTRVLAGNSANSLLVQKLRSDTVVCGSVMPTSGITISDADFDRIKRWIDAGACNN